MKKITYVESNTNPLKKKPKTSDGEKRRRIRRYLRKMKPENMAIFRKALSDGVSIRQKRWDDPDHYWYYGRKRKKWFNNFGKNVSKFSWELFRYDIEFYKGDL
jgi:hypothetical protein